MIQKGSCFPLYFVLLLLLGGIWPLLLLCDKHIWLLLRGGRVWLLLLFWGIWPLLLLFWGIWPCC
jgi:hypothetical protein